MCITVEEMVRNARTRIRNVSPAQVEAYVLGGESLIVDLREADELTEHGLIAGAHHVPRGLLEFWADPASPTHRPAFEPTRSTILYCAAGSRSALAAETLQALGYRDVAHLEGGIAAWKQAGFPVAGLAAWHR